LNVYLTARHIELSERIREHVEKRLIQPLREYNSLKIVRVEIQIYQEAERGPMVGCHVLVEVKGHHDINIREIDNDVFAAVDLAKDRTFVALKELRDKMLTLSRHPKKYSLARIMRSLGLGRRGEPA
jgi:ribosomal subunit interface protein